MLSEQVSRLINLSEESSVEREFLLDDLTLNWSHIADLLRPLDKNLDDIESCFKLKEVINTIILSSLQILDHHEKFIHTLNNYDDWTFSNERLVTIFNEFHNDPENFALCGFLETTAILEFALGSVYQCYENERPPHLLRDVLIKLSSNVNFQENQIFILQILLGTAKSSNLRNISWHGFVESLQPAYLAFLLVIIASFAKQLQNKTIKPRYRASMQLKFEILWPTTDDHADILRMIPCNKRSWVQVLRFYKERKFSHAIHLLLVQIESCLRLIYSEVNDENDVVRAQLNKYYVIMDSIFYEYILSSDTTPLVIGKITKIQEMEIRKTHKRNKMLEYIPRSIYLIYYDLFYAVDGPRLRDKLSHGEVIIDEENCEDIFNTLFKFIFTIIKFHNSQSIPENIIYESKFMSILKFARKFTSTNQKIENFFMNLKIPSNLTQETFNFTPLEIGDENEIKIYFRPAIETQITKMMINILDNFNDSIGSFEISLNELLQQYQERKLSSSRRNMLENSIQFLPNFSNGFYQLLHVLNSIFVFLQNYDDTFDNESWNKKILKILKYLNQTTEIYQKFFSAKNRNFFIANTRTNEFLLLSIDCKHLFEIDITNQ